MVDEARGQVAADSPHALLTPAGRRTLSRYLAGHGRIVVEVDRAADIRQLLRWAAREKVKIAIAGGSEAAAGAGAGRRTGTGVRRCVVQPAGQLRPDRRHAGKCGTPATFRRGGLVRAAWRRLAQRPQDAPAGRQCRGQRFARADGLAGLTRVPAQAFGVADQIGSIEPGKRADLVLWEGDPLDVAHYAEQVWLGGRAMPMRSRQTELRDRYLQRNAQP